MKLLHKDRADNRLLDEAASKYEVMHLGVLHCYQGDRVLEITHCGNECVDPDKECPCLLRHLVVW